VTEVSEQLDIQHAGLRDAIGTGALVHRLRLTFTHQEFPVLDI
jgi:hypothetical protein